LLRPIPQRATDDLISQITTLSARLTASRLGGSGPTVTPKTLDLNDLNPVDSLHRTHGFANYFGQRLDNLELNLHRNLLN
jgi:hypothetical protein